jgi:mannose-6-phosphate isomerase
MPATRLSTIRVEKPWGRHKLWPGFADAASEPVGEIWFEAPAGTEPELLVKYLFTSERLSIQAHPDDAAAQVAGYPRGKDEAWIVLAAEPDATIALGLKRAVSQDDLRAAALDGSIVDLVDWKPVKAGDVIYSPAGTVHAIGAGLTLIEVQQALDLTYRLYDYGRPRELHLDAGIAVSEAAPFYGAIINSQVHAASTTPNPKRILLDGPKFAIQQWTFIGVHESVWPKGMLRWLIPVRGAGRLDGAPFQAGECWLVDGTVMVDQAEGSEVLWAIPKSAAFANAA